MALGSKILIYSTDPVESERLVRLLMYQRFVPKAVDAVAYITLALVSGEYPILLCCYSEKDTEIHKFLQFMRNDNKLRSVIPIIIIDKPTQSILTNLITFGCSNFILKEATYDIFIERIETVAQSLGDVFDKRQFVRIEIPEYENAQLLITARNGHKYPVKVSNISMGGLQLTWSPERVPVQRMVVGDVLMNCLLVVKDLDLYMDIKIISVFNFKAGTQIIGLNEERQAKLCNFIYERLLSENVNSKTNQNNW